MNIICKNTQWPFLIREDMRNFLIFEFHDEACIKETMEKIDCHIDENLRQSVDPWDTGYDIEWNLLSMLMEMTEWQTDRRPRRPGQFSRRRRQPRHIDTGCSKS